jgi:hypothetical protein
MEARLNRLEGRAELPENYRIVPSGMIHGEIGLIELRGDEVSAGWPDTPHSRRILTGMAWAHWHTTTGRPKAEGAGA